MKTIVLLATTAVVLTISTSPGIADTRNTIDFTKSEKGELYPGGTATSNKTPAGRRAFSHPSGDMPFSNQLDFRLGGALFKKLWVSSPAATKSSDGLGPLYNARSCLACHLKNGRGHPPSNIKDNTVSMLFRVGFTDKDGLFKPDPVYGGQIQAFAIQGFRAEGKVEIKYRDIPIKLNGGKVVKLRKPTYSLVNANYGPLAKNLVISPRIANQMIGLGLLDTIPTKDILAFADPKDKNSDGISGRANWVRSVIGNKKMVGRFNWKAGNPTVRQQSAAAFKTDIGLSTTLFSLHAGDCTSAQQRCQHATHGAEARTDNVEISDQMLNLVTLFSSQIAVPRRRNVGAPKTLAGKKLFYQSRCISCHRPKFIAGIERGKKGKLIWPYTDLLLHDMGRGLADGYRDGMATGNEWRTAPLWGIGLTKNVSGHTFFLHDGRARNLLEAILWHGGEATQARQKVIDMTDKQRDALIAFLNSL